MFVRSLAAAAAVATIAACLSTTAGAAGTEVTVEDSRYRPDVVQVAVGAPVVWRWSGGNRETHNVRHERDLFESGPPTSTGDPFQRVFSAGTFYYLCDVHGFASPKMDGYVKVPVIVSAAPAGANFTVKWATNATNTGSKFDVQYRVGSGRWKAWKSDIGAVSAVFGAGSSPVAATPGERYSFRARSKAGRDVSRWSPIRSYQP